MENLVISLNAVLPLFIMMAFGYGLKGMQFVDEAFLATVNRLCFKILLPILLFNNIYTTDFHQVFNPKLIGFALSAIGGLWLFLLFFIPLIEKENAKRGVMIQGMFRSNYVLLGIPIVTTVYPEHGAGIASLLAAAVVPLYNVLAVTVLEIFSSCQIRFRHILRGIVTNPLIIASALALAALVLEIRIPSFLGQALESLSGTVIPLALMAMGGSFAFRKVSKNIKQIVMTVTGKLLVIPGVFVCLSVWAGFRYVELLCLAVVFAAPVAVSSYPMALQANADGDLAAQIVVFTTAAASFTLLLFIFVLRQLGLI